MFKTSKMTQAICLGFGSSVLLSTAAFAQEAPAKEEKTQQLERIVVTGSRIKAKTVETEGASPVISLGAEAIKVEGLRNVEGLLNNLPQVFADQGGEVSNGASGTATVNLRGLGANRNLVLVNGRRLPAGSPRSLPADLNQVPVSLIKKVEVLSGGASAVYGSDAISGVVNFQMNDRFRGVQLEYNNQFFNHTQQNSEVRSVLESRKFAVPGNKNMDGKSEDFSITLGSDLADGKGNATAFFSYKKQDPLLQSERDFTACALNYNANAPATALSKWSCGGSGTSFPGQFTDFATYAVTVADGNGNIRPFASTDVYNFGPLNYFQRPSERYTGAMFAHYDVNDMARVYTELGFHDDQTVAQIAPSGLFFFDASGANSVKFENPFLSQAWKNQLGLKKPGDTADLYIARRNVEGGGRQDDIRHTSYRAVVGVKGDLNEQWSYDASTQIGRVVYQETYKNDFSNSRIGRALDAVVDPATGKAVCRSALNGTDPNCRPYNIWALGKVTPEALAYLQTPGFQKGFTSQISTVASLSGDLTGYGLKMPWASSGAAVVAGVERRSEAMELSTDTAFSTGDLAGQGGPTIGVDGKYSVNEYFGEFRLPLAEKQPFAHFLNTSVTFRNSSYSTGKKTDTFGLGLEWAPVKSVKTRLSAQQAVRAANIIELFSAAGLGLYDMDGDPCAGAKPTASLAECQRTGVTAAQYGKIPDSPAGQYNLFGGGNPNLKPETANTVTAGLVLMPMRDLSLVFDYFNINVKDTIGALSAPVTLQQCLTTGNPVFCGLIKRDNVGSLWATPDARITTTNQNIGSVRTEGVDFGADYGLRMEGMGRIDVSFLGTYLNKFEVEDVPGLAKYDCVGYFGSKCGTPTPKWRHKLRTSWNSPFNVNLSLTWRHIDSVDLDASSSQARLKGSTSAQVAKLDARDYFDIAAAYNFSKSLSFRLSVNNLLDKDPPLRTQGAGSVNGNTYPVVYDSAGRRVNFNVTATF
jgi:iron complex outermembrane receptor protein